MPESRSFQCLPHLAALCATMTGSLPSRPLVAAESLSPPSAEQTAPPHATATAEAIASIAQRLTTSRVIQTINRTAVGAKEREAALSELQRTIHSLVTSTPGAYLFEAETIPPIIAPGDEHRFPPDSDILTLSGVTFAKVRLINADGTTGQWSAPLVLTEGYPLAAPRIHTEGRLPIGPVPTDYMFDIQQCEPGERAIVVGIPMGTTPLSERLRTRLPEPVRRYSTNISFTALNAVRTGIAITGGGFIPVVDPSAPRRFPNGKAATITQAQYPDDRIPQLLANGRPVAPAHSGREGMLIFHPDGHIIDVSGSQPKALPLQTIVREDYLLLLQKIAAASQPRPNTPR